MQRTTRFLSRTKWWVHDSDLQQKWLGNENSFWEIGELAWKERTHSSLSRKQHFQFLPDPRSEINRDQQCERCWSSSCKELSAVGKRGWQSSALVSPTKTLIRDVAPIGDDIERVGENLVQMSKWETKKMRNPCKHKFPESE